MAFRPRTKLPRYARAVEEIRIVSATRRHSDRVDFAEKAEPAPVELPGLVPTKQPEGPSRIATVLHGEPDFKLTRYFSITSLIYFRG